MQNCSVLCKFFFIINFWFLELQKKNKEIAEKKAALDREITHLVEDNDKQELNNEFLKAQHKFEKSLKPNLDLVFLVDCTGSMSKHISATKNAINMVSKEIKRRYNSEISFGFVGYRDHDDGDKRIEALSFTSNIELFSEFVGSIKVEGGGDACEDVFGGLEASIDLKHSGKDLKPWQSTNRVLIHIADAPCHGSRFHCLGEQNDNGYNDNIEDKRGLRIERLIADLKSKDIKYYFAKINQLTDKMINEFKTIGGENFITVIPLTKVEDICKMAVLSITDTISWTADMILGRAKVLDMFCKEHKYRVLDGNEKQSRTYHLEEEEPNTEEGWKIINTKLSSYEVEVMEKRSKSDDNGLIFKPQKCEDVQLKQSINPFAKGCQKIAYFCIEPGRPPLIENENYRQSSNCVLKSFQYFREGFESLSEYESVVKSQTVSRFYAKKFNEIKPSDLPSIQFLETRLVQVSQFKK